MSDQVNGNNADDVFVADPDAFDDDFEGELPGWTKPVGVLSIIWGSIGLICGGIGTGFAFLQPTMMSSVASQMQGGVPDFMLQINPLQVGLGIAGAIWAVLNIVAGVLTVGRNYSGRLAHLIWAAGSILLIVASAKLQLDIQGQMADWMQANPDADFTKQQQMGGPISRFIGIFLMIFFAIWPTFCLFWFGMVKRTPKDFTGGLELNM